MSKKQLHHRIDRLFADLAGENERPSQADPQENAASLAINRVDAATSPNLKDGKTTLTNQIIETSTRTLLSGHLHGPFTIGAFPVAPPVADKFENGFAVEKGAIYPAAHLWTMTGYKSAETNRVGFVNASEGQPAAIALPLQTQSAGDLLLEIVDDEKEREWSEDDRFLVMEVASQLGLALDNAQLYLSVQKELAERIRAEQAILRRNKDLASLNRIGQRLSRLATRSEIFESLSTMIGEVISNRNLYICYTDPEKHILSFPIYRLDGQDMVMPEREFRQGVPEYVINNRMLLLITEDVPERLQTLGIELPDHLPASLLAIPMVASERTVGAIVLKDFEHEKAFDSLQAELLSTAAAQATTALENADLFQQMQNAVKAIENRERYQANVARAAALLTEYGTRSLADVLKLLGQAARCSRVYFAQIHEDERGLFWSVSAEWADPSMAYLFDKTRIQHIPVSASPNWLQQFREKGWATTYQSDETPESRFIEGQHIRSTLLLAISSPAGTPSLVAFDQVDSERKWLNEEINPLRVAADAISNTFIREGLMEQLQTTLDETEDLYKASNRLALANDLQEMVEAVLSGGHVGDINRAVLLLFEYDNYTLLSRIVVGASWYSGRGAPPPPVGFEYPSAQYSHFLQISTPVFYDDISEGTADQSMQALWTNQDVRSLAVLPLWSGKRQIGALLLLSEVKHHFTDRETRTYLPLVDQMAISVENQRLFEQTQKALDETELLYNVSNHLAQTSNAADILSLIADAVMPEGADSVSLMLIETGANGELVDVEMEGTTTISGEYQRLGNHLSVSAIPLVKSLTDEPLLINDIQNYPLDPASRSTLEQYHMTANCLVPLRSGGKLIGVLIASSPHSVNFSREDSHLLRIMGSSIAVALEKQRLLRQTERRALELQTASEIARDTANTLSLDLLLNRIVNMLCERFNFDHASLYMLDESSMYAIIREAAGEAGESMKSQKYRLAVGSRSVVGVVTATGEPVILNDIHHNPMYALGPLLQEMSSELGVPLRLGSTIIGALDLHSKEINAFNQDDVTVLQILADQIAIAIENARAYELSQKAVEEMKEIDRVKSQFLANMSHELRTPLNSIIGFSKVILKGIDGPINSTQNEDLTAIYNSGQHLLSLINDILDLSKIEAGKMELSFSDVNISDMVNSAMSTAAGLVKDKPIRLVTHIPEALPTVRADSTRVRQVLINFLSNAAKFTEEGAITVEASTTISPEGQAEIMVTVTDTGAGIAPQDQSKLFLPFSQVDDSPTRKTGGTGLGLSICRSLIEMHGGRIGLLRSVVGEGSTFFFTLPLSDLGDKEKAISTNLEGTNIVLAIDDDPKVINLYERYLKPYGYQVMALTDPKQAVQQASAICPVAITLDIMMPDVDGWKVLRDLKNNTNTRDIPIIVCSILEDQEKGFSMGAADYLVKPFLQEDIIHALDRLNQEGKCLKVLVIDDDPADLRLVQKMLEENPHFQTLLASGGKQGWEMIQKDHPDIIILDLFMPDMNGFSLLEALRTNPEVCHIPVIILTGADLSPEQIQQLNGFGQDILSKGFLQEKELLVLLEEALRQFHPTSKKPGGA